MSQSEPAGEKAHLKDDLLRHLAMLADERKPLAKERDALDARVRALNGQILLALNDAGSKREQLLDGTVVMIVAPDPRPAISREKLLAAGVDPQIIADCTDHNPVAPYPRVDYPKVKTEGADAQPAAAAPEAAPGSQTVPATRVTH